MRHKINTIFGVFCAISIICSIASCSRTVSVWSISEGRIVKEGETPVYFIGTNLWYASELAKSDPERLSKELDALKELGVCNLRILATHNDTESLAKVLKALEERDMYAVLYLNNAWEWSEDGYRSYLEKAGEGRQPHPAVEGYNAYTEAMKEFAGNEKAMELFHEHVRNVVRALKDSPAIFSWQICNEPRPFSTEENKKEAFTRYIYATAALIKSIDPLHMVSTGNEGSIGCNGGDMDLYTRINECRDIDYITIHIWPYNWSWVKAEDVEGGIGNAIEKTKEYIDSQLRVAYILRKPVVIEEFGYPRDRFDYRNSAGTNGRDAYYRYIFSRVLDSARDAGMLAGCNFWAWSGYAAQTPGHQFWQEGDELCGDPFQEAQGLNGVYLSDESTIKVIRDYADSLNNQTIIRPDMSRKLLFTDDNAKKLDIFVSSGTAKSETLKLDVTTDLSQISQTKDTVLSLSKTVSIRKGRTETVSFDISSLAPGFYKAEINGTAFNFGINPEDIESPQDKPEDFDAFWKETLDELAATPMDAVLTKVGEYSNELRETYILNFKSLGGAIAGGVLTIPVKEGKYPVSVEFMGYGSDSYFHHPSEDPGTINFLVSVRDQGLFKDGQSRWIDRGIDKPEEFYYRGAFCDVVRAVDYVATLPKADPDRIFAWGDSQGGAFTWISASLGHKVRAIAPSVPFLGDFPDYAKIVWWPMHEVFQTADENEISREKVMHTFAYFDIKNFTDRVECPVYMAFGMQDPVCPPHTNFAGYNMVRSVKKYFCVPTCGHDMWQEMSWKEARKEFFDSFCR